MYTIYLTNHGYSITGTYATIESAKVKMLSCGFECILIDAQSNVVLSYSPIRGFETF